MLSVSMINSGHIDIIINLMKENNLELDLVLHAMKKTKMANKPTMFYLKDKIQRFIDEGVTSVSDMNKKSSPKTNKKMNIL